MKNKKNISNEQTIVFVSGTFDIMHGAHIQFFQNAKAKGGSRAYLIVSFTSDATILNYKGRISSLPENDKRKVLESIKWVDEVVKSHDPKNPIFDFKKNFDQILRERQPKKLILISTTDDKHAKEKIDFCKARREKYKIDVRYLQIPKTKPSHSQGVYRATSTSEIIKKILRNYE